MAGQQTPEPATEPVPAGQVSHWVTFVYPEAPPNVPAGQAAHWVTLGYPEAAPNVPNGQGMQLPPDLYWPAGQGGKTHVLAA